MKKLLFIVLLACVKISYAQIITTLAGTGAAAFSGDGGPANSSTLNYPNGIAIDASGNIYINDSGNARVRKISTSGIISTIAGTGSFSYGGDGGPATAAELNNNLTAIAIDAGGNIYISDYDNNCIRKVNNAGIISTVVGTGTSGYNGNGGPATAAEISGPAGIAIDASGNLYFADKNNEVIRMVNTAGIISTIAGVAGSANYSGDGGAASTAELNTPWGLALDIGGNLYISDQGNNRIRKINNAGIINTVAGQGIAGGTGDGGQATDAYLAGPGGVAIDASGNLYIADNGNQRIRIVNSSTGIINNVVGTGAAGFGGDGGEATSALLYDPNNVAVNASGNIYITDDYNNDVRFVCTNPDMVSGLITDPGNNPIHAGQVFVFRPKPNHNGLLDTAGFATISSTGTYTFTNLPNGNYYMAASAASTYSNAVVTYYSNKAFNYRWDSAVVINHYGCGNNQSSGYDIEILETSSNGTGIISGNVNAQYSYGQRLANGGNSVFGSPLKGVDVKLGKSPGGGCSARTNCDANGNYVFTNVDTGSYSIFVDIPNFGMVTILNTTINAAHPNSVNNDYCVDSIKIYTCSQITTGITNSTNNDIQVSIYPNPSNGVFNISVGDFENTNVEVYNIIGEKVLTYKVQSNLSQIDITNFSNGMYQLRVIKNNASIYQTKINKVN